ncbi:MAG TPA: T9SS type A sorting domain-containing protein [bacterium]|jgi:hypothetical protein
MRYVACLLWLCVAALPCHAAYLWLSNDGQPLPQDSSICPFITGDTIQGEVHCNGPLAIAGHPVFYGQVSISAPAFSHGPDYNPEFHGPQPIFNAPQVEIPTTLTNLRQGAAMQGQFYDFPGKQFRATIAGGTIYCDMWDEGTPFDSTERWPIPIVGRACLFFDGPLELKGSGLTGQVTIGSSHDIRLIDNITYAGAGPQGQIPVNSLAILGIASEHDIKIANTPANGRWNSDGLGSSQNNSHLTSIVIDGLLWAGGSITFDQQNDIDSGYVCECVPDERGTIYLYGSMVQSHWKPLRRSTNTFTGYMLQARYDWRIDRILPPCWQHLPGDEPLVTDTLNFGNVAVGQTVWDTAYIVLPSAVTLGSVIANYPFYATRVPPFVSDSFAIPTRFIPPRVGQFTGILYISVTGDYFQIVLRGRGMPAGGPQPVVFDVAPNPFNLTTTLSYSLPEAGAVKITLFDVLGRSVKQMDFSSVPAGAHTAQLNAEGLSSGVYFVSLKAAGQTLTQKILLLK